MYETVTNVLKNAQANAGACNARIFTKSKQNISNAIKKAIVDHINSQTISVNV